MQMIKINSDFQRSETKGIYLIQIILLQILYSSLDEQERKVIEHEWFSIRRGQRDFKYWFW